MIIRKVIEIDGKQFDYTKSDAGFFIERDNKLYDGAIDPLGSDRAYVETVIPLNCNLSKNKIYHTAYNIVIGQEAQI